MSPAASTQSTAMAVPTAGWVPDASPLSEPSTGRPERADIPTSANATRRTTVRAAAAATTATATNDAQSMCTDDAPSWSGNEVEVRDRRPRDIVNSGRGDGGATGSAIDPRGQAPRAPRDDDYADSAGRGQPRGRRPHDRRRRQGEAPG